MSDEAAVPSSARLVRDFVNTYQLDLDEEYLTSTDRLRSWLAERGLVASDATLRPADLATAVTVREGLRSVLLGHAGHEPDPAALERLDRVLADVPLRLSLAAGPRLVPGGTRDVDRALAGLLDAIRRCAEEHTWERLKVCASDACRWAYYDTSRNQTRRWCSMAVCGNSVKMRRAYAVRRARRAEA
ncbi:CGNR zinc finger domain-containing protein [Virgisporangium aurantiacum]|uniref:Zinc finger CGNR domain-containing protein n=1 Tax=Virgisporangium aurantiacum TaxID=175570 RepID=A0A8J3ZG35_9ACTN|nr:CGNR zinc finger domain-containing protein [Virgisporangium aurantiacum]GIJ61230.1 hypothetical protein Vau01_087460 [Virgisporangium aurantiacum]